MRIEKPCTLTMLRHIAQVLQKQWLRAVRTSLQIRSALQSAFRIPHSAFHMVMS